MKRIMIGLICLGFVGVGAFLVSHLQSPVTNVTVVTIHAAVDPAVARGQIWIGEENSYERTIEIEVRGRSLRLPDNFQIWNETYETIASRRPMIRLNSVDLPTLGRPTTATTGRFITSPRQRGTWCQLDRGARVPSSAARKLRPSVGTTSTGCGRSLTVPPSRNRSPLRHTSGSR